MSMRARMIAACLVATLALPAAAQEETAPEPPEAPLLLPHMQLHDPWIVADAQSGTYYLFTRN